MSKFEKLTIVILASTERETFRETIRLIGENCDGADIAEMIIFLISENCPPAYIAQEIIKNNPYDFPIRTHLQTMPGLSGGFFETTQFVKTSHFLVIGADLEMDPMSVPKMIEISKQHPDAIVCASKFKKGAKREHYGLVHYIGNRTVNFAVERILNIRGTEILITFQIYPKDVFERMHFTDIKRTFYQYTLRPLTRGVEYIEIPTDYIRRTEGASNFNLKRYIDLAANFLCAAILERKKLKKNRKK